MSSSMVQGNSLNIRRFHAQYRLPVDHPNPESLQNRLDETITTTLPETLENMTERLEMDDAVVLIQRLELELTLNAEWDKAQLARHWAQHILRELLRAVHSERDGGVVSYPNRPAFVACFLADLAKGQAWGKWYYQQFDGLKMLPVSAAIRTALCDPDNGGTEALLWLSEPDLVKVLHQLTTQDARRVLTYLASHSTSASDSVTAASSAHAVGGSSDDCLRVFHSLFEQRIDLALPADNEVTSALRLYIEAYREIPSLSGPLLMQLALAIVEFTRYLIHHSPEQGRALIRVLTRGDKADLYRHFSSEAEFWMPLLQAPAARIEALGQLVLDRCHGTAPAAPVVGEAPRHTFFGGMFLLLPLLDELPVSEITKDWPALEDMNPSALLRLLLLLKCLGQSRTAAAFFDPVLRDFLAVAPAVTPTTLADWQASLSQQHLEVGLQRFQRWQHRVRITGDETLVLTQTATTEGHVALLLDCAGGWLYAGEYESNQRESLAQLVSELVPPTASRLVVDSAFIDCFEGADKGFEILSLDDERIPELAETQQSLTETFSRLDRLENELAFLALPKAFTKSRRADLCLTLMAHGLLRVLARHLPGFSRSTLPYLYANFLDFGASVEVEDGRYLVRLERPPLHIVLSMTGMARNHYRPSWLDGRVVELYPEG